ncbi:MAG: hypothetical protein AAF597_12530, partial [Bacteroidota bacterium]
MEGPLPKTSRLANRLDYIDQGIDEWGLKVKDQLIRGILSLNLEGRYLFASDEKRLVDSVGYHSKRFLGEIDRVSLRFVRHGIFLEHGVGNGRLVYSPEANAAIKSWLYPVLPQATEDLADTIADRYADQVVFDIRLSIPGIINTTVAGGRH